MVGMCFGTLHEDVLAHMSAHAAEDVVDRGFEPGADNASPGRPCDAQPLQVGGDVGSGLDMVANTWRIRCEPLTHRIAQWRRRR